MKNQHKLLRLSLCLFGILLSTSATSAPKIITDIKPIHSLVAMIAEGVTEPEYILPANADAHDYAMRPSEARKIQQADLIFWIGPELTPWFQKAITGLGLSAKTISLINSPDILLLDYDSEGHAHSHDHEGDVHTGVDPHIWLDPQNAIAMLKQISSTLISNDPDNTEAYAKNTVTSIAKLEDLLKTVHDLSIASRNKSYYTYHDAYQYYEHRFNISAVGSLLSGEAHSPSAAELGELKANIKAQDISCVFLEPTYSKRLVDLLTSQTNIKLGTLDVMGNDIMSGPYHYPEMITQIAVQMNNCLD